jgi:hypothetical protein
MNLQENIHRIKEMMGLDKSVVPFELFGITERLVGYETANFALYAHLFSKLYDAYKKGNLEKEYSILMSDDNVNRKMVKYFYNFIINNDKFFKEKEVFTESDIPNYIKEEPISPEIFEDVINNFIIDENSLLMNYVKVHDVKLEYYASFENYILDVTAYVKEGNLGENNTWNGVGPSLKWSSFVNRLSRNKIFKNYLGLPVNNNYENFYITINGNVKEGFPEEEKIMETKDLIKKVLKEEISSLLRRRLNFGNIDSILKKIRIAAFRKDEPTENSIIATIQRALYDIMPEGFEEDDEEYFKVWDEIKDYLKDNYTDELREYFEKRKKDAEEDTNPLGIKYIFVKHDKPYYVRGWSGFADGFKSFDEMITKYGNYVDVDWDEIKNKLDKINDYPEPTFSNTMNSRPLRISSIGDEGNNWGYNFSIIKQIPKNNIDKIKSIQTEENNNELDEYARTLKNARQQGVGLRFPKSAIKANPMRFRPYNRK